MDSQLIEDFMTTTGKLRAVLFQNAPVLPLHGHRRNVVATGLQLRALFSISDKPGITSGELAKELAMSNPAMAQLMFRLIRARWVEHKRDPFDRRVVHFTLTDLGQQEMKQIKQHFFANMEAVLSLISEADVRELVRIQKEWIEKLEARQSK